MNKNKKAFTLVELIVVITILAILGTIAFISLQGYSKDARDSTRISDINSMKTSLELFNLNAGKYPDPDSGENVTFSGGIVWTQGTIGGQVITNLNSLSKKPIDPLIGREYAYSVLNTKQEYQLGTILEGGQIGLSGFNDTYAAGDEQISAYITGNYNGVLAKVSTGSITYVLAVPCIISSEVGDLLDIITNKQLSYDGFSNLWRSYSGTLFDINGETDLTLTNKLVLYSGVLTDLKDSDTQIQFASDLQFAYSGTQISNIGEIENILMMDTVSDVEGTRFLIQALIQNSVDHTMLITATNTTEDTPTPIVEFVSTWNTENIGGITSSNQIKLPLNSGGVYDFTVDWGDAITSNITTFNQLEITHTYATAGIYDVTITGDIEGFQFGNGGDKTKLIEIKSWGPLKLGNSGSYFSGCSNLTSISATDLPDFSGTTTFGEMFGYNEKLSNITNINLWDISGVSDMHMMFAGATLFNQDIGNWDVSNVTNMPGMFWQAESFDQDISMWDITNVVDSSFFDISTPVTWLADEKPSF
ncbi:MAG: BspA family leucine-rich repeat surface protein [Candidatus Gracilibacteria bacterium]